jgi:hypothetical protein
LHSAKVEVKLRSGWGICHRVEFDGYRNGNLAH